MSYLTAIHGVQADGGNGLSLGPVQWPRPLPASSNTSALAGWLQIGLGLATLASVSFILAIIAAGAV
jgi:hypothetical protein